MGTEKIKPELNGVAETMLLTFYARAQYSKSKKHAFYDAKIEASVAATGAKFTWGANSFAEMESLAPGFVSVKDDNILRGMVQLYPIYRLVSWMPMIRKMAEKILIFQKKSSS